MLANTNIINKDIGIDNRHYINQLRGASILRVMMAHLGLSWFYLPYSSYVGLLLPLLFFVSGAVSYFSFLRAQSITKFIVKRVVSIVLPFYILFALIGAVALFYDDWTFRRLSYWFLMRPEYQDMPFSLGQVWYLQTLTMITLMSVPFFYFSRKNTNYLRYLLAITFIFICIHSVFNIHQYFIFGAVDFYLAISNGFFFVLGALYYSHQSFFTVKKLLLLLLITSVTFGVFVMIEGGSLGVHKESPSLLYIAGFLAVLSALMLFKTNIQKILGLITPLNWLFVYCSKHAYSLFLLHTLMIGVVEAHVFTESLTGNAKMALVKMVVVIALTLLIAPVFTTLCNSCTNYIKRFL